MPDKLLQQYLVKPLCQVRCSEACKKQITMADPKRALHGAYRFSFLMTLTIDSGFAWQKLTMSYSWHLMTEPCVAYTPGGLWLFKQSRWEGKFRERLNQRYWEASLLGKEVTQSLMISTKAMKPAVLARTPCEQVPCRTHPLPTALSLNSYTQHFMCWNCLALNSYILPLPFRFSHHGRVLIVVKLPHRPRRPQSEYSI